MNSNNEIDLPTRFEIERRMNSNSNHNHMHFERRLTSLLDHFQLYEDRNNQAKALRYVPQLEDMRAIARAKYESCMENPFEKNKNPGSSSTITTGVENEDLAINDLLILEIMDWFKNEFFQWVDKPDCTNCSASTIAQGHSDPTLEEGLLSASRVEVYSCPKCSTIVRFPRYNNPAQLLDTRKGRCGEWANCFALILRSAGYEIRHITDWTDHVWVEVFSKSQNRWLHVDPCENSIDKPLLYEVGWGKKLSYVIGVSQDDIQDCTWRYSKNHKEVLSRRHECNEVWLTHKIVQLRKQKQALQSGERKNILLNRLAVELAEFLSPKTNDGKDKDAGIVGRTSGSLAWRLARQEVGFSESSFEPSGHVWRIKTDDISSKDKDTPVIVELNFDCAANCYNFHVGEKKYKYDLWSFGVFESQNIIRKEESDWKMVYLARKENTDTGFISWKLETTEDSHLTLKSIQIKMNIDIFHPSATSTVTITNEKGSQVILTDKDCTNNVLHWKSSKEFEEMKTITVSCEMKGGEGTSSWQHSQLFRQKMLTKSENCTETQLLPFRIILNYN